MTALFPLAAFAFAAASQSPSNLVVSPCEFNDAYQFAAAQCDITLHNTGDKPIRISEAKAIRPGDDVQPAALTVAPKGTAYLTAKLDLSNSVGRTKRYFRFKTDETGQGFRNSEVAGYVQTILDEPKPTLDFAIVDLAKPAVEKTIELTSREVADLKITGILDKPAYLDAEIGQDGRSLRAKIRPDAPWGLHQSDYVKLKTNAPQQSQVWVAIKADMRGEVVPDSNPFAMGLMRLGQKNEFLIRLTSPSGKAFKTGALKVERVQAEAEIVPCLPASDSCKMIRLRLGKDQRTGEVGGVVWVDLPDFGKKLPVYVWGMLVGAKTEVKDLDEEFRKASEAKAAAGGQSSPAESADKGAKIDLKQALGTISEPEDAKPAGTGPLLKWRVEHEMPVYGYAIYRSDSKEGPFLRINEKIITAKSAGQSASNYYWRDNSAVAGKKYWYYIGILQKDGVKQKLTEPQEVLAK